MKNKLKSLILVIISIMLLCQTIGCAPRADFDDNILNPPNGDYDKMFVDTKYENGFIVSSEIENDTSKSGIFDYGGEAKDSPIWRIAQWNCYNNNLLEDVIYTKNNSQYTYSKNGNIISVDTSIGKLGLQITTSNEYGANGITSNPRQQNQPWPTLLVDHNFSESNILRVYDKTEIRMSIDYMLTKFDDNMPSAANTALHSAQFQWFITLQNRNIQSKDFSKYIWFGLSFFDARYDFAPMYAAEDGGKEENTGMFIYMPSMKDIMGENGRTQIDKRMKIDFNAMPLLKDAFSLAQKRKYLLNTEWEDLYIGATNMGWEVTGTYDAAVDIYAANILYK